jgi:zinc carboxypeptidase
VNPRQLHTIGHSVEGRPIELWSDPAGANGTLIIGGIHADESAAIPLVREFAPPRRNPVALLPLANPDGLARASRYNARGVDINRNAGLNWRADSEEPSGDAPWSEPETRALRDFILNWRPAKIIALHWALGEIDADGVQSTTLAEAMWNALSQAERRPYRLRVTEAERLRLQQTEAECPGSLGRWAGYGLIYPDGSQPAMITLELPYDASVPRAESLPDDHFDVVCAHWARDPESYLATVRAPVFKMLKAACELIAPSGPPSALLSKPVAPARNRHPRRPQK